MHFVEIHSGRILGESDRIPDFMAEISSESSYKYSTNIQLTL